MELVTLKQETLQSLCSLSLCLFPSKPLKRLREREMQNVVATNVHYAK